MPRHEIRTRTTREALRVCASIIPAMVAMCLALPGSLRAQAARASTPDAPSTSADTRRQTDSLAMYLVRTPKGKPAALSVGGKVASQARKLDGRAEPAALPAAVITPLPTRARSSKP